MGPKPYTISIKPPPDALDEFPQTLLVSCFRRLSWDSQNDTTYNFFLFCLEGLGFRV